MSIKDENEKQDDEKDEKGGGIRCSTLSFLSLNR